MIALEIIEATCAEDYYCGKLGTKNWSEGEGVEKKN